MLLWSRLPALRSPITVYVQSDKSKDRLHCVRYTLPCVEGGSTVETKDYAAILLSCLAFSFSIAAFVLNFRQRAHEDRYSARKNLTDVIAELSKTNIAFNQLELDHPKSMEPRIVAFRRTYNMQRRYLANQANFSWP